ncbi:MAG: hypothetical protein M3548_14355 [Actinomycetota bacterium]|nr:hypothetical protein [Actinomycetota bacterium]
MVRRSVPRLAMVSALTSVLIGSAGCEIQDSDGWRCTENRCDVTISGSPTLELLDARVKATVAGGRVKVSGGGVTVTLNPGEAAMVDGVKIEVISVDHEAATLVVTD